MEKPVTLIILGPVGSGKGTQAKLLAKKFGWLHLSSGELLRERTKVRDELGRRLEAVMRKGKLVPSWAPFTLVLSKILVAGPRKSVIIDGSPRTMTESEMLDEALRQIGRKKVWVLHVHISERETMKRLMLRGRSDDFARAIRVRMKVFRQQVLPVIQHYRRHHQVIRIKGEQSVKEVHQEILKKLNAGRTIG